MFRQGVPANNNSIRRFICRVCRNEQPVPVHHDKSMKWILTGSFRKEELLACTSCNYSIKIPSHCGIPMFYSEAIQYLDMPDYTSTESKLNIRTSGDREGE